MEYRDNYIEYYIEQGYIDSREDVKFKKIVDACNCFGRKLKGMQQAYWNHPLEEDVALWFPKLFDNGEWENKISDDETIIYEKCIKDDDRAKKAIEENLYKLRSKRLVFTKVKDEMESTAYSFKGLYEIDSEETLRLNCSVYRKIEDRVKTYRCGEE